ncbi:MAG: Txe/YoeB family addiction module toxin [Bacteroidota bacterium]
MAGVVEYTLEVQEDIAFFKKTRQVHILKKIRQLIESIQKTPFEGIGKPEPLKYALTGCWSRRITKEHRLVYEVSGSIIFILSVRGHY